MLYNLFSINLKIISEIVAQIDEIEGTRTFGTGDEIKKRQHIFVNNNSGRRIQITLRNESIEKFKSVFKLGNVSK